MKTRHILTITVMLGALSACGGDKPAASDADSNATGKVLDGTISDAMITTDQVTSQAPPMKVVPGRSDASSDEGDDDATDAIDAGDAAADAADAAAAAADSASTEAGTAN
ncbi:hypothetical protein GRI39_00590 [Altererythrobacter indicus]|uniref:Secreted protein n=1 Tax=Altericroceibacterium indicum TaxID=374177 RepID=A0A845ABJ1_9SPHN|nr:hypothetical protein [Altericroceibacterium indicum]MXP24548.1 hypothetical protein [Altericroceibacterium indicum]